MKKTLKTTTLAMTFALILPIFASAAPRPNAEGKDWSDNVVVRVVKTIKKLVIKALEGPMIPPPNSDGQH
jgi:hypothetical protein